jgi:hypothetical protein
MKRVQGLYSPLFDGVHIVASAEAVDRVIEQTPADARFYAGWQPGELGKEIDTTRL